MLRKQRHAPADWLTSRIREQAAHSCTPANVANGPGLGEEVCENSILGLIRMLRLWPSLHFNHLFFQTRVKWTSMKNGSFDFPHILPVLRDKHRATPGQAVDLCRGNQTKKRKKKATFASQETIKIKPTMLKMAANGAGNGEKVKMKCLIGQITHQEGHFTHTGEEKVCLITGGALMAASVKLLQQPIWPSTTGRPLTSERGPAATGSRCRFSPAAAAGMLA